MEVEDLPEIATDPFDQAVAAKNRGNKYFRGGRWVPAYLPFLPGLLLFYRYELAIKCYTEAIDKCPEDKTIDLATFYQVHLHTSLQYCDTPPSSIVTPLPPVL